MGISALRQYHAASAASAPEPEPDFRELYKAAQRELDVLRLENAELRAQLAPPVVVPETTPPAPETVPEVTMKVDPGADPATVVAAIETELAATKPRARR